MNAPTSADWVADTIAALHPLATIKEAESALRVSARTLRRMVATGQLRAVKLGAGGGSARVLIPRVEIERYLRERTP